MNQKIRLSFILIVSLLGAFAANASLAREALPEYTLKAGFVYNFALLTDWPADALSNNIDLCYIGEEEIHSALTSISGKQINNRPLTPRRIEDATQVSNCNIIYITKTDRRDISEILQSASSRPVLTVTDDERLAQDGAIFFIRPEGQRLVFEINTKLAQDAKLNISSRLFRLARKTN